jgi:FkbM family methyltransferase
MDLKRALTGRLRSLIEQSTLAISTRLGIDILDLAYRQKELCVCDVGEREFLHYALKNILNDCPSPILLDVGANKGDYTAWLVAAFPHARVHGFEPNPETFKLYSSRFKENNQVIAHQLGLSNTIGISTIYAYSNDHTTGHASLERGVLSESNNSIESISCRIETLDHLADTKNELSQPLFIKLDIEGFERHALEGAKRILEKGMLRAIQFEFNSMNIQTRAFLRDFYEILGKEFQFFRLNSRGMEALGNYSTKNEIFIYQNIVAVKREWSHLCPRHWPQRNLASAGT